MSSASDSELAEPNGPRCMHVIGIGRTGAVYVEALLRTGEIEDYLVEPDARFAAMVVDIGGGEDMEIAKDYAAAFVKRLESRQIPTERFQFQGVSLPMPPAGELAAGMEETRDFLKLKAPGSSCSPKLESVETGQSVVPEAGEHVSRAIAKTIYADACYAGDRPMDAALDAFAKHVEASKLPSLITVCFSLAGGTGGGIAVDLARHLSNVKLGRRVPVIGVGQLPSSGDPQARQNSPSLYATLNDLDCMLDDDKNATVAAMWGELYRSPFTGGFFVVNPEQSWQRLTAYTTTGEKEIRQKIKQMVTNRFVADSFMRLVVIDGGHDLIKALQPSGLTPTESDGDVSGRSRNWTLFDVAKLTHPGVQVLPGEGARKWEAVIRQWIDFMPQYSGLTDGFKTDYAEVFIYASRNMGFDIMKQAFRDMITENYLLDPDSKLKIFMHEFFDTLTAYANVVLPGVAKTDLITFWESQKSYDALSAKEKLSEHAWLVDAEAGLPQASAIFEEMAGKAVWGCTCWNSIPDDQLRGASQPPVSKTEPGENRQERRQASS